MPSHNSMLIFDNADDFINFISYLQDEYDKMHGQTGSDEDE